MSVKSSQSGTRILTVLEAVSASQPIGVTTLARQLGEDKSAVQRALATLSGSGWIRPAPGTPARWELSTRLFEMARLPSSSADLRDRARPVLEHLRDRTGETAMLVFPEADHFVVVETAESTHTLRMAPRIGMRIEVPGTATARAVLAYKTASEQEEALGRPVTTEDEALFAETRRRGYGISRGEVMEGSTTLAAPVMDLQGRPEAVLVITGPSERLDVSRHDPIGTTLRTEAEGLSRAGATEAA